MKILKTKLTASVTAVMMLMGAVPSITHAAYSDTAGHWAAEAIDRWTSRDVIKGSDNQFRPNANLTRAEAATILCNAIGYEDMSSKSFNDVSSDSWYKNAVSKINEAGVMVGDNNSFRPNDNLTREEAAAIIARTFEIEATKASSKRYEDQDRISSWASNSVRAMTDAGYLSGSDGYFLPLSYITRAEMVTMLDKVVSLYITKNDSYAGTYPGYVVVKTGSVTLEKLTASGMLISPSVKNGVVTLNNTTIKLGVINLAPNSTIKKLNSSTVGTPTPAPAATPTPTPMPHKITGGPDGKAGVKFTPYKDSSYTLFNQTADEVMSDIIITDDVVTGNSKYVSPVNLMGDDESSGGNYLIIKLGFSGYVDNNIVVQVCGEDVKTYTMTTHPESFLSDRSFIAVVKVDSYFLRYGIKFIVDTDGPSGSLVNATAFTLDISNLKLLSDVEFESVDTSYDLNGLTVDQMISNVSLDSNLKMSGTVKFVENYTEFSDDEALQSGYYFPVKASVQNITDDMKIKVTGGGVEKIYTKSDLVDVSNLIIAWRLTDAVKQTGLVFSFDFNGDGSYESADYKIDVSGLVSQSVTFGIPDDTLPLFGGKTVSDLTENLAINSNLKISGTSKYITDYVEFSVNEDDQEGNYIVIKAIPEIVTDDISIQITGTETHTYGHSALEADGSFVTVWKLHENVNELIYVIDADGEGDTYLPEMYKIDISDIVLEEKPEASETPTTEPTTDPTTEPTVEPTETTFTVVSAEQSATAGHKTQADFSSDFALAAVIPSIIEPIPVESTNVTLNATGTLNYITESGYWLENEKDNGHFIILKVTPDEKWTENGKITRICTGLSDSWANVSYSKDDLYQGSMYLFIRVDDAMENGIEITVDNDGEGEAYNAKTIKINFTDVVLTPAAE